MNKPITNSICGTQPIPGYTLRKRLGSGGYGEVWLADAPGGLQKAVKLIYGHVDESRATSELRSLERIRRANHPFLLSIERIEVVQGKLIIVTELAEGSLLDRFEHYRCQHLPGIPRTELLDYLRDTAEALDFLAHKHSLQHLDVKPANLLMVADRVKVADFGLVKDLQDANQSLVGGLTPTYSAPEVFEGRPSFRSDQYSLAIVYMEMLTGRLPFSGKSAGDLARQHLSQSPELEPLPPLDRSCLRRALSKNPQDRFSNCKQFIDQLMKVRSCLVPVPDALGPVEKVINDSQLCQSTHSDTNSWKVDQQVYQSAVPVDDLVIGWTAQRSMFIGVGGQGIRALGELRRMLSSNKGQRLGCNDHQWLAIDTSPEELQQITNEADQASLSAESVMALPILSPQSYRQYQAAMFAPLSRRWLYNIPRSLRTEGVRPIATLSLIANYASLQKLIQQKLANLVRQHVADPQRQSPLNIYVLSSLHGGTGSAILAEVGMIARGVMSELQCLDYQISAVVSAATIANSQAAASLPAANAMVSLAELLHWMDPSRDRPQIDYRYGFAASCICPFDWVTLVDGGLYEDRAAKVHSPRNMAHIVALDCQTSVSVALAEARRQARNTLSFGWLRTAFATTVSDVPDLTTESISLWCCWQSIQSVYEFCTGMPMPETPRCNHSAPRTSDALESVPPAKDVEAQSVRQILLELGIADATEAIRSSDVAIQPWMNRTSEDLQVKQSQFQQDLARLSNSLIQMIRAQDLNWPQICLVQLKSIEALHNFCEAELSELAQLLDQRANRSSQTSGRLQSLRQYFNDLGQTWISGLQGTRAETIRITSCLESWWSELRSDLESLQVEDLTRADMPADIQQLCDQVQEQLNEICLRPLIDLIESVDSQPGCCHSPAFAEALATHQPSMTSCGQLRLQAIQLVDQTSEVLSFFNHAPASEPGQLHEIQLDKIHTVTPPLASVGGQLYRCVIVSQKQHNRVSCMMERLGILKTTTILPSPMDRDLQLLCDASQLNVAQLVSLLWRPSAATLSLAERLRSRVDIDWDPIGKLFERGCIAATTVKGELQSQVGGAPGTALGVGP
jgi:serine/threonine protein kinase